MAVFALGDTARNKLLETCQFPKFSNVTSSQCENDSVDVHVWTFRYVITEKKGCGHRHEPGCEHEEGPGH